MDTSRLTAETSPVKDDPEVVVDHVLLSLVAPLQDEQLVKISVFDCKIMDHFLVCCIYLSNLYREQFRYKQYFIQCGTGDESISWKSYTV